LRAIDIRKTNSNCRKSQHMNWLLSGWYATQDEFLKAVTTLGLKKGRNVSKQTFARMLQNHIYTDGL